MATLKEELIQIGISHREERLREAEEFFVQEMAKMKFVLTRSYKDGPELQYHIHHFQMAGIECELGSVSEMPDKISNKLNLYLEVKDVWTRLCNPKLGPHKSASPFWMRLYEAGKIVRDAWLEEVKDILRSELNPDQPKIRISVPDHLFGLYLVQFLEINGVKSKIDPASITCYQREVTVVVNTGSIWAQVYPGK